LASAGLLNGRTLTSWPGIRDDLVNSGATWLDRDVVKDGNLVTSRGPQDMTSFVPAIIDHFADTSPKPQAATTGQSDPQLNSPVSWAVAALRWSPKPSLPGALAGLMAGARLSPEIRTAQGLFLNRRAEDQLGPNAQSHKLTADEFLAGGQRVAEVAFNSCA
jgi:protease I